MPFLWSLLLRLVSCTSNHLLSICLLCFVNHTFSFQRFTPFQYWFPISSLFPSCHYCLRYLTTPAFLSLKLWISSPWYFCSTAPLSNQLLQSVDPSCLIYGRNFLAAHALQQVIIGQCVRHVNRLMRGMTIGKEPVSNKDGRYGGFSYFFPFIAVDKFSVPRETELAPVAVALHNRPVPTLNLLMPSLTFFSSATEFEIKQCYHGGLTSWPDGLMKALSSKEASLAFAGSLDLDVVTPVLDKVSTPLTKDLNVGQKKWNLLTRVGFQVQSSPVSRLGKLDPCQRPPFMPMLW